MRRLELHELQPFAPLWKNLEKNGTKWKIIPIFAPSNGLHDMVKFIGEYSGKVDDKGRIILPSAFKAIMLAEGDMRLVIKKDIYEDCLEMYTFREWERQSEEVKSKLNPFNRKHAAFWREYMRNRAVAEPDSKLGRISIPKRLMDSIGIGKEVVFCGSDHKIELWAKERYESSSIPQSEFLALTADILSDIK